MNSGDSRGLRGHVSGVVLEPQDDGYDAARRIHNGLIDKHPAVIIQCKTTSDIAAAIRFAREHKLEIAVKGGGHNVAGRAMVKGGLVIDLSLMKAITVDSERRTVTAEGGVTLAELNRETQKYNLATTGGVVSTTGVAGLTLGGGYGYLAGKHGLALDNLLSATVVSAKSEIMTASERENADLFWAIRGGGGNFGVVSSFTYRAHPVGPTITAGLVAWPVSEASAVLRLYRELASSSDDEVTVASGLLCVPSTDTKVVGIIMAHFGSPEAGAAWAKKVKGFGSPMLDTLGPMTYCDLNGMLDKLYPSGALYYWKSNFLAEMSDPAIETMIETFHRCPSSLSSIILEHWHGAAMRVPSDHTAFPHRREGHNFLILSEWTDPARNEVNQSWTRATFAAMQSFSTHNRYVNYLDQDEGETDLAGPYGANHPKLSELKAKYDPGNIFHLNQNIRPR